MFRNKIKTPTIIQVSEEQFRIAGSYGSELISILREDEKAFNEGMNSLLIRTNTVYDHYNIVINAFNHYLKQLRLQENVIAINILLD